MDHTTAPLGPDDPVVIVGAGQGGLQAAMSLRDHGFTGPLTLVGAERTAPYQRPPLSKSYLAGADDAGALTLRPPSFFQAHRIRLRSGVRAVDIDRVGGKLVLDTAERLPYRHLVLATGARPRALPIPGTDLAGVQPLRTVADADELRRRTSVPARLVIIGGGLIGMEAAATAVLAGHQVTVIEQQPRILSRVLGPDIAAYLDELHRAHGTTILTEHGVLALHGEAGRVREVRLDDGSRLPADIVLVCVGVLPNTRLATFTDLGVADGILVDDRLRTCDPAISAIGDCASFPCGDRRIRLESVHNAVDQARHLGALRTGALDAPFRAVPRFWTHQFQARVQMAGLAAPDDESVVDGDPGSGRFTVRRFRDGRLSAVESVNQPAVHLAARRLLAAAR